MTPSAELWSAVVKHCATGRGYAMTVGEDIGLYFYGYRTKILISVQRSNITETWYVMDGCRSLSHSDTADEAVRAALRIVAPSTEPNVSC